jgi:hypothetical protein
VLLLLPAMGEAQASGQAGPGSRRWEVEWYGGLSFANPPASGTATLPAPGAPLTTSSPIFPSRQVPSWFFGDGAQLLNDVNAAFGLSNRVSPLDAAFDAPGFDAAGRAAFGVRVRREMNAKLGIELSLDVAPSVRRPPDGLVDAAESSEESFEPAIGALLSSGPFSNVVISTTRAVNDASGQDLSATAALNIQFGRLGSFVPYVTAGGGVAASAGDAPSVTLEGRYRFSILGIASVDETDRVTVRVERGSAFVAVVGGGVRRQLSGRWGLCVDGRLFVGPGRHRLLIDASPSSVSATPAGFIESFTHPSVQFSNHASTGRQSTLSAPPLQGFQVFESDGLATRGLVTVGLAVRF